MVDRPKLREDILFDSLPDNFVQGMHQARVNADKAVQQIFDEFKSKIQAKIDDFESSRLDKNMQGEAARIEMEFKDKSSSLEDTTKQFDDALQDLKKAVDDVKTEDIDDAVNALERKIQALQGQTDGIREAASKLGAGLGKVAATALKSIL